MSYVSAILSEPQTRPWAEIQRAHDALVAILTDQVPPVFDRKDKYEFHIAASVLCWVLEHDHNTLFEDILDTIAERLRAAGVSIVDTGRLIVPEPEEESEPDYTSEQIALLESQHAELERLRQDRIAAGIEHECRVCGCSETKACPDGCHWANEEKTLCSQCSDGSTRPH